MLKKAPQSKEVPKEKIQIVEQQNQPFLRSLQKKVRNINKRLVDIAELELKENLKPEQVQKVNRKPALLEERARIEETALLFKESYLENAAIYRHAQLKELDTLARAIVLFHSGATTQKAHLSQLWESIQQINHTKTLNESISALSISLREFANDKKLQKSLTTYIQQDGDKIPVAVSQPTACKYVEKKVEQKQQPIKIIQQVVPSVPVVTPTPVPAVVPVVVPVVAPIVAASIPVVTPLANPQPTAQKIEAPIKTETPAPVIQAEKKGEREEKRSYRDHRGRGEYKPREEREGEEKRQYRPKYAAKEPTHPKEEKESSQSEEEAEVRNFRREEIRQLEDDGFIITKPKPKVNEHRQPREFENRQHGKKPHYHNQNSNFQK